MANNNNETLYLWDNLNPYQRSVIVSAHVEGFSKQVGRKLDEKRVLDIFKLVRPRIVVANNDSYCRVFESDQKKMETFLKNYIYGN